MHAFRRCRGMQMAVFDMAGTVINEGGMVYSLLYETMHNFGLDLVPGDVNQWHGASKYAVLDHFLRRESTQAEFPERRRQLRDIFNDNLKQCYFSKNAISLVSPEIPELFNGMRYHGTIVALNTGYPTDVQMAIIHNLRLGGMIDDRVASDEVRRGRPYPDMINKLMLNNDIDDPGRVMKIGDTPNDILEGKRAGCAKTYGVLSGMGTREALKKAGATDILDSLLDIKI